MMKSCLVVFACLYSSLVYQTNAQRPLNNDPVVSFKAFWHTYQTKYATFDMKGVDWQQQYARYAPLIDSTTSPEQLFAVLSDMVRPLNDAHVRLAIRSMKPPTFFWPRKPSVYSNQFQFSKDSVQTYWQATDATLAKQGFESLQVIGGTYADSTREFYYAKSEDYGYIRISECTYGKGGSGVKLRELDRTLAYFGPIKGLLIDIRFNRGAEIGSLSVWPDALLIRVE